MSDEAGNKGPEPEDWFEDGKCRVLFRMGLLPTTVRKDPDTGEEVVVDNDPEVFFPDQGESTRPAKEICLGSDGRPPCRILDRCREYAIYHERFGVWGGMSERERAFQRKRAKEAKEQEPAPRKRVVRRPNDYGIGWGEVGEA